MRTSRRRVVAAAVLGVPLVAAAGCAAPAARPVDTGSPGGTTSSRPTTAASPATTARRGRSVVVPQPPRAATLPSGRTVPVERVGTTSSGLLDVPDDVDVAGWWRGGARLGDPFGSILVAAHVDSRTEGLGPFAELLTAPEGARLQLRSGRLRQTFEIRSRRLVRQGSLADDPWIFDPAGETRLTLVTCAPPYDPGRGGYQNLAVVTATPLGRPEVL